MLSRLRARLRYRRMQRLLRQLDRADERERRRPGSVPRVRGSARGPALFVAGMALLIAALLAVRVWLPEFALGYHSPAVDDVVHGPAPVGTAPYAFINTLASGRPVTYSSCEPVHYVINPAGMPSEIPPLIRQAVEQISSASGLRFIDDGTSNEQPSPDRLLRQPERYGRQWAPILVVWADQPPATVAREDGSDSFGMGGSTYIIGGGARDATRYVTGEVTLFSRALTPLLHSDNGPTKVRVVITHELGHVIGLAHTNDPNSLMTPKYAGQTGLGSGDLEGLRQLGHGACVPDR